MKEENNDKQQNGLSVRFDPTDPTITDVFVKDASINALETQTMSIPSVFDTSSDPEDEEWDKLLASSKDMLNAMIEDARASDSAGLSWSVDKWAAHEPCSQD